MYDKPTLVEEFGCNDYQGHGSPTPEALHDGMWAPLFGGAANIGSFWDWQIYDQIWINEFHALNTFIKQMPFDLAQNQWQNLIAVNNIF